MMQSRVARRLAIHLSTLLFCLSAFTSAGAATLPAGFTETQISGLSNATAMALHPDGRIFVCQQTGELRVIKNGVVLPAPFLALPVNSVGERGLLGVAFDPNYATNRFVYVYYTATSPATHNRVSRFTADSANEDVAIAGSEVVLLDLENLSATNHNGGAIHFGPDGKLYIATGENAVPSFSQSLANRLGKILRINSDGTIPEDNPTSFPNIAGSPAGVNRAIWAVGLRNPFTFAFQPGTTRMFINDVGQSAWEEINDGLAGSNYGWPNCEGACSPPNANFRDPLFQYSHGSSAATGCAIAGGAFYNPTTVQFGASYVGKYFFADLCSGWIRVMDPSNNTATGFASGISNPVDLQVALDGSLYYLARDSSSVFRVRFNGTPPALLTEPNSDSAAALTSPTAVRDPFPLTDPFNLSSDNRKRAMLFAGNLELLPSEDKSAVTARVEDAGMMVYPLEVEFVGKVPNFYWLTQIVVILPSNLPLGQSVLVSVTVHGQTSNKARIRIQ